MSNHQLFSWILSVTSIWCTFKQGDAGKTGWAMGTLNTLLWITYTITTHQWGLIPLNIVLAIVNIRNFRKQESTNSEKVFMQRFLKKLGKR